MQLSKGTPYLGGECLGTALISTLIFLTIVGRANVSCQIFEAEIFATAIISWARVNISVVIMCNQVIFEVAWTKKSATTFTTFIICEKNVQEKHYFYSYLVDVQ